jgi:hypothetical protein
MGWQSFIVFYSSKSEILNIMKAMDEYQHINNNYETESELEEVGEILQMICFCKMKKPYVKEQMKGKYAVMFGIGGGRSSCYSFFANRNVKINFFEECNVTRLGKQDDYFVPFEDFKKFPENFMEQLIEKNMVDN